MPSSYTKTAGGTLLALQSVAASSVVVGSAVDVSSKLGGLAFVRFGRRAATAAGVRRGASDRHALGHVGVLRSSGMSRWKMAVLRRKPVPA